MVNYKNILREYISTFSPFCLKTVVVTCFKGVGWGTRVLNNKSLILIQSVIASRCFTITSSEDKHNPTSSSLHRHFRYYNQQVDYIPKGSECWAFTTHKEREELT